MRYDIEADWQLLNTCNYRCAYCFVPHELLGEKLAVHAEPETWKQSFDRTGSTWLLHVTGGEPSLYPGFAKLCQLLTEKHYLSFNSNLSNSSIVEVAERVDPSRISFINAGLHAKERESRRGLEKFLEHAACLNDHGFPLFISIVATPDVLHRAEKIIALTRSTGLTPIPKLLRGSYEGKTYPDAYSAEERAAFVEFANKARDCYSPVIRNLAERPTINIFGDEDYLDGTPDFRGRICSAGVKFVGLEPDGSVYRCERKQENYLGNILDGSFRTAEKSRCDSSYCFYWCLKYSDEPKFGSVPFLRNTKWSRKIRRSATWRTMRSAVNKACERRD
jgi:MoaA/NifB/PqqE/SkfB family radical SAM enzyme